MLPLLNVYLVPDTLGVLYDSNGSQSGERILPSSGLWLCLVE